MSKIKCLQNLNAMCEAEKAKGIESTENGILFIDGIYEAMYEITHDEELMAAFEKTQPKPVYLHLKYNQYKCTTCSGDLFENEDDEYQDFCGGCGQALKWPTKDEVNQEDEK